MRKVCFIECRIVMPMLIINSYVPGTVPTTMHGIRYLNRVYLSR